MRLKSQLFLQSSTPKDRIWIIPPPQQIQYLSMRTPHCGAAVGQPAFNYTVAALLSLLPGSFVWFSRLLSTTTEQQSFNSEQGRHPRDSPSGDSSSSPALSASLHSHTRSPSCNHIMTQSYLHNHQSCVIIFLWRLSLLSLKSFLKLTSSCWLTLWSDQVCADEMILQYWHRL